MEVSQIWWPKWVKILLTKMVGQTLEHYYLVEGDTDQLFSGTKYFILEGVEQSEL